MVVRTPAPPMGQFYEPPSSPCKPPSVRGAVIPYRRVRTERSPASVGNLVGTYSQGSGPPRTSCNIAWGEGGLLRSFLWKHIDVASCRGSDMSRGKSRRKAENSRTNRQRLVELFQQRPAFLPKIDVIEFSAVHLRLQCEDRSYDYWPSTGRVWETNSARGSMILTVDELWSLVSGESQASVTKAEARWQRSSDAEHERRVREFLGARRH